MPAAGVDSEAVTDPLQADAAEDDMHESPAQPTESDSSEVNVMPERPKGKKRKKQELY